MKRIARVLIFLFILIGPFLIAWDFLHPTGFWQRLIFLVVSIPGEVAMLGLGLYVASKLDGFKL